MIRTRSHSRFIGFDGGVTVRGGLPVIKATSAHGTTFKIARENIESAKSSENAFDVAVAVSERYAATGYVMLKNIDVRRIEQRATVMTSEKLAQPIARAKSIIYNRTVFYLQYVDPTRCLMEIPTRTPQLGLPLHVITPSKRHHESKAAINP